MEKEKKTANIHLKVKPSIKKRIEELAEEMNMNVSQYVIHKALKKD